MMVDTIDEKILAELDNDARIPNTKIAGRLKINKNVVNYRIKQLENKGIIRGYYTIINAYKLGYQGYRLYLKLQYTDPLKEKEIMDYFIKKKNTWWMARIKGNWDMAILFWVNTQKEMVDTIREFFREYRDYVGDHTLVVYYGIGHYRLPFAKKYLKTNAKFEHATVGEIVKIDNIDRKLLGILSSNARGSLVEISKKLKLTPAAVRYRIKQLIKNRIILGFRPIFDISKLKYSQYKLDINLKNTSVIEKMYGFAKEHDNIFYLDQTLGYADVEFEIYVLDQQRFFDIIREIRMEFNDAIKDHRFFIFEEITKIKYMPG
ncbi:MAG: winged helix-turn-helix transcriptional regulator [Candidatus Micrarchaeota archaeon]